MPRIKGLHKENAVINHEWGKTKKWTKMYTARIRRMQKRKAVHGILKQFIIINF